METTAESSRSRADALIRDAIVVIFLLLLAFAAADDITTDNDTNFTLEYGALLGCWLGLTVVAVGLWRRGQRAVAAVSFVVLPTVLWAGSQAIHPGIGPGDWMAYLAVLAGFLWFGVLATLLLTRWWRALGSGSVSLHDATGRGEV
jgi:hypothetical protein